MKSLYQKLSFSFSQRNEWAGALFHGWGFFVFLAGFFSHFQNYIDELLQDMTETSR